MAAYYNEIEPFAVHVLKQLIRDGVIADGDVDDRSIVDVRPEDLRGYTQCHFFAGGGLWSVALRLAGWDDDRPLWTGSCPCQPFSVAGKGAGTDDPRHLWPHFFRLIRSCRPALVLGEQVAGRAGYGWFDGVRADLEGEGYASRAVDIPACAVNAPHIRQRLYWVGLANASCDRQRLSAQCDGEQVGPRQQASFGDDSDGRGYSGDVANAESIGRRGRAHDEDEGRREQPSSHPCEGSYHPCEGSSDVADATSRNASAEWLQRGGVDGLQPQGRCDRRLAPDSERPPLGVANAESFGRRGRAHDEDEGRREQPSPHPCEGSYHPCEGSYHPCEGSSDMADALKRTNISSKSQSGFRPMAESNGAGDAARSGDMVDTASIGWGEGWAEHELRSGRPAIASAGSGDVADADDAGREGRQLLSERADELSPWSRGVEWRRGADGKERRVKSGVRLLVDGLPGRVGQLRLAGNAIVPQVAAEVIKAIM